MPSLFRWFERRATARRVTVPCSQSVRSARLLVEALEDRAVPAVHTWTGAVNGLWSEPGNWDGGVPTSNEDGGAVVAFGGNTASTMDIVGLQVDTLTLAGTNNVLTLNGLFGAANLITRDGTHTITGEPITFTPNAVTGDSIVQVNDTATLLLDSPLTGFLALRKTGAGTLSLQNARDALGALFVEAGALNVLPGSFLNNGVLVNGGTLVGSGTIRAVAANDSLGRSVLAPGGGTSVAALIIGTGDLAGSTYQPAIAGANSDRINLIGLLDLTGSALSVQVLQTPTAASYTLIDNAGTDAITGTFNNLPQGSAVFLSGQGYTLSYVGGDGNDVVLIRAGGAPGAPPVVPPIVPPMVRPIVPPLATLAPVFSGAQVVGDVLVMSGAGVPNGVQFTLVPFGSSALFTDLTGDGNGDVVLLLPDRTLVLDGQTGRLLALATDDNGDGIRDLQILNSDGTTTRVDGRTGIALVI